MNIHKSQLFWGSPGVLLVLTHPHIRGEQFHRLQLWIGWDTHWTHGPMASWMRQGRLKTESCPANFWKIESCQTIIIVLLIYPTMYVPIILYIYTSLYIHPLNACVWCYFTKFWTAHSLNSLWRAFDVVWLAYAWPPKRGEFRFLEADRGEIYPVLPKKLVYGIFGVTFEPGWSLQIFTVETKSQISMSFGSCRNPLQNSGLKTSKHHVFQPFRCALQSRDFKTYPLAIEDSYGKWPSSRCYTVFYHVFNHVYHVLPCRIYVLSMAYPYFPMCFTMCLPIKSSFFWLSHVLPEGHLAPGPAHRWHWSFTRSAMVPPFRKGDIHGIPWISCHFSVNKIRRSEITMVFFQRFHARFQGLFFGGHVEVSTESQGPDLQHFSFTNSLRTGKWP